MKYFNGNKIGDNVTFETDVREPKTELAKIIINELIKNVYLIIVNSTGSYDKTSYYREMMEPKKIFY